MRRFAGTLFAITFAANNLFAQGLGLSGGPHAGIAFSSFKQSGGDPYGMGILFGGHGEISIHKYISLRLTFDYATFGADKDKLKGVAQDASVKVVEEFVGGPLNPQDVATVRASVKSADGARVSAPSVFVAGLAKIPTGSMITPYGLLGIGMTFLSFGDLSVESSGISTNQGQVIIPAGTNSSKIDSETKFGLQFGGGTEFRLSKLVKLMFEVKYHMVFTSGSTSSYFPIVVGATFGG